MSTFDREKIKNILVPVIVSAYTALEASKADDIFKNTLDIFSWMADSLVQGISTEEWLKLENRRQTQKTLQNAIGDLHQKFLGTVSGAKELGVGQLIDLVLDDKKILAEIKNKWNTTKGNHKVNIYDDLEKALSTHSGYTAYCVEILPKNGKRYDKPFTPPDNKTKKPRPKNEFIRVIDGYSFYALVTGQEDAIKELYILLPELIGEILKEKFNINRDIINFKNQPEFETFFKKVFDKK